MLSDTLLKNALQFYFSAQQNDKHICRLLHSFVQLQRRRKAIAAAHWAIQPSPNFILSCFFFLYCCQALRAVILLKLRQIVPHIILQHHFGGRLPCSAPKAFCFKGWLGNLRPVGNVWPRFTGCPCYWSGTDSRDWRNATTCVWQQVHLSVMRMSVFVCVFQSLSAVAGNITHRNTLSF